MNEQKRQRIADAGPMYGGLVRRAYEGKASPRMAIRAFCLQCVGYVRKDVTNCTAEACPLWEYRPYQQADDE